MLLEQVQIAKQTKVDDAAAAVVEYHRIVKRNASPHPGDGARLIALLPIVGKTESDLFEDVTAANRKALIEAGLVGFPEKLEAARGESAAIMTKATTDALAAANEILRRVTMATVANTMLGLASQIDGVPEIDVAAQEIRRCRDAHQQAFAGFEKLEGKPERVDYALHDIARQRPWLFTEE